MRDSQGRFCKTSTDLPLDMGKKMSAPGACKDDRECFRTFKSVQILVCQMLEIQQKEIEELQDEVYSLRQLLEARGCLCRTDSSASTKTVRK